MNFERENLISALENANRNRNIKLFDYYQEWFTNKDLLCHDVIYKIKADLGVTVSRNTVHYIRSRVMPKRLEELKISVVNTQLTNIIFQGKIDSNSSSNAVNNFEFKEPKSIDHNQEIVTIRKSKNETS